MAVRVAAPAATLVAAPAATPHQTTSPRRLAVLAVATVLVFALAYRYATHPPPQPGLREAALEWVANHYAGSVLAGLKPHDYDPQRERLDPAIVSEALDLAKVRVHDFGARGRGNSVFVRIQITVDGQPPKDGVAVRYVYFSKDPHGAWVVERDNVSPLAYYVMV